MTSISSLPVTDLHVGTYCYVDFPSLNKNDHIIDNDKAIKDKCYSTYCYISRVIELDRDDFITVSFSLLADRRSLWNKIGGQELPGIYKEIFNDMCSKRDVDPNSYGWINNPDLLEYFRKNACTKVILVKCQGSRPFFVNTEGHDYARYVGRLDV